MYRRIGRGRFSTELFKRYQRSEKALVAAVAGENPIHTVWTGRSGSVWGMVSFLGLLLHVLASPFRSQARLEAEIVFLRHQLNLLRRRLPAKPRLTTADRLLFVWLYRLVPSLLDAAMIIQPDTIVRWHRAGFRSFGGGSRVHAAAGPRFRSRFAP